MITLKNFIFNDYQVNTYLLFDESNDCIIIDAACSAEIEKKQLSDFIESKKLNIISQYDTHCHIDHILGNNFVKEKYHIELGVHEDSQQLIERASYYADYLGFKLDKVVEPSIFLKDGDIIKFGNSVLEVFYTPGHAAGSLCFYSKEQNFVITGDVLFQGSIGRTDLPTGNFQTLINSIKTKLLVLYNKTIVYPGHGPSTSIGFEKKHNQFL